MLFQLPRLTLLMLAALALAAFATVSASAPAVADASQRSSAGTAKSERADARKARTTRARRRSGRRAFRYSSRGPRARITKRRRVNRGKGVRFSFKSDRRRVRYQCRTDRRRKWRRCRSPFVLRRVKKKEQKFLVRAHDPSGTVGAAAVAPVRGEMPPTPVVATPPDRPVKRTAPEPAPEPAPAPATGGPDLRAPGFTPLSDAEAAARVVRSPFEPRPENGTANATVPTAAQLAEYRAARTYEMCRDRRYDLQVTGNFTGTTDEILQWAAWKWGLDIQLMRTAAVVETSWNQALVGDNGQSFGLLQLKRTVHEGTFPLSRESTAFAADYYGAFVRHVYDGCAGWLNDVERGSEYRAGDIWGSMATWYAGRWYANNADWYLGRLRTELAQQRWLTGRL